MPLPKLPHQQLFFENRPFARGMLVRCLRVLRESKEHHDGLVTVESVTASFYGLIHDGRVVRAGQFTDGRAIELSPEIFAGLVEGAEGASFSLYGVEPELLGCLDLVLSRHPALQGVARYLPLDDLDRTMRREGRDAVLTVGTSRELNIARIRAGVPARLYLADRLAPNAGGTILEQLDRIVLRHEKSGAEDTLTLALYDHAAGSAPLLESAGCASVEGAGKWRLTVTLGGRTIQAVDLSRPVTTVGRIRENDVVIDNLGVSRHHCAFVHTADGLVLEDRGSLNGLVVNDRVVRRARVAASDVILVGKHKLIVSRVAEGAAEPAPSPALAPETYEPTMALDSRVRPDLKARRRKGGVEAVAVPTPVEPSSPLLAPLAELASVPPAAPSAKVEAHRRAALVSDAGLPYAVDASVVTIGSDEGSDVKIDGLLVKRRIARIVKDGTGRYRIEALSRLSRPRVNGAAVSGEEILLDGDEVRIGPRTFVFQAN